MTTYHPSTIRRHRKAWFAELRSGNRQQVKGYLSCPVEDGDGEVGFCCLGVATDMAKVPSIEYRYMEGLQYVKYGTDAEYLTLPHEARTWLGVTVGDPFLDFDPSSDEDWSFLQGVIDDQVYMDLREAIKHDGGDLTGALLNDKGATFEQIADLIEHFGFSPTHDVLKGAA